MAIPPNFTIKVHEDGQDTAHLVLAPLSELAESEMAMASGGYVKKWDASLGRYETMDSAISFWDDINGPTYHGGPRHNAS